MGLPFAVESYFLFFPFIPLLLCFGQFLVGGTLCWGAFVYYYKLSSIRGNVQSAALISDLFCWHNASSLYLLYCSLRYQLVVYLSDNPGSSMGLSFSLSALDQAVRKFASADLMLLFFRAVGEVWCLGAILFVWAPPQMSRLQKTNSL